ncbi:hypothetical protein [Micromonospora sp. NPDC048947]|uniref:hypothetical protein n=1 Tax=Micromonospora sp. NPDC048947 TaxID=3154826 RepID=UPI0034029417
MTAESGIVVEACAGNGGVQIRLGKGDGDPIRMGQIHRSTESVARLDPREQQPPLLASVALSRGVVGVALRR